jgi:hypothetical protein
MLKLKDLKGEYKATAIFRTDNDFQGVPFTLENADKIAELVKAQLIEQGCTNFERKGNTLHFGNQFFNLPNMPSKREGIIVFRSKDYHFSSPDFHEGRKSFGNKPKASELTTQWFYYREPPWTY